MEYEKISDNVKMLWRKNFKVGKKKYTQVSGYIFNDKNELLIVKNKDVWTIPGGHPEKGESRVQTLKRELMEEGCVTLKNIHYLGSVEVVENGEVYYQTRYVAYVDKILPFKEEYEINERKFVKTKDLIKYIKWANGITFSAQIKSAEEYLKNRKLNILVYQPRASYYIGGGEVYPLQNVNYFAKLGHNVTLLTTRASFIKESDYFTKIIKSNKKIKVAYLDLDDSYRDIYDITPGINWERWDKESLFVSRLAYEYISKHKEYDIISIHNIIDTLAVPSNRQHVLHLHGSPTELNYICKLILDRENNLIAVSNNVREKFHEMGINKNMKICTNGVDDTVFTYDKNNKRDLDILFVGRLIPIKGVQYLLEAIKILKDKYKLTPNLKIIGKGPYKEDLEKMVDYFKIAEQVTFCGLVDEKELIKSYQSAKLCVFPSYEKEGIMSTLLEAASCKTPSITTKKTSMEEFALDDKNALLTNKEDSKDICEKIYKLLTDEKLRNEIANNAYNEVKEKYTWKSKTEEIIKLYREFINE